MPDNLENSAHFKFENEVEGTFASHIESTMRNGKICHVTFPHREFPVHSWSRPGA